MMEKITERKRRNKAQREKTSEAVRKSAGEFERRRARSAVSFPQVRDDGVFYCETDVRFAGTYVETVEQPVNAPIRRIREHVPTCYTYMFVANNPELAHLYGPHTVAHTLLDYMMERYCWRDLFDEQVRDWTPEKVLEVIAQNMNWREKRHNIMEYYVKYCELYQELCKQVDRLRESENANTNEDFSEFGERLFRILSMHPYGTYGWQEQKRATHKQLRGKGEGIIQQTLQAAFDLVDGAYTFSPPFLFPYLADRNAQFADNEEYKKFVEMRVHDVVPIQEWRDYIDGKLKLDDPKIQLYETLKYMVYMFYEKCLYNYGKLQEKLKNFKTESINWEKPQSYDLEMMRVKLSRIEPFKRDDFSVFHINLSLGESETEADRNTYVEAIQTMISDRERCFQQAEKIYSCIQNPIYIDHANSFLEKARKNKKWFVLTQMKSDISKCLLAVLSLPLQDGLWDSADNQIFYKCKDKILWILGEIGRDESPAICVNIPYF